MVLSKKNHYFLPAYLYKPIKLSCVRKTDIFKDIPTFLSVNIIATSLMTTVSILISS